MTFQLSPRSKDRRAGVDPRLIEISDLAIRLTVIDFGIPRDGGVRIALRQNELYLDGKSKCDGYRKISRHQPSALDGLGKALDFYAYVDGKANWAQYHLAMVACAHLQAANILGHSISWGGLWKTFKDYPHIELID